MNDPNKSIMDRKEISRRQFFNRSLPGAAKAVANQLSPGKPTAVKSIQRIPGGIDRLGGMTLPALLAYHKKYLTGTYIPNWERGVDWQYGGFDNALSPGKAPNFSRKSMYHQARGVWMFSYLYNNITHNKRHLDAAVKGRDFLVRYGLANDHCWISQLDRQGKALSKPLDHYGDMYMVLALGELYKATKNEKDLELAINTATSVMNRLLSPFYMHTQAHLPADIPCLQPGTRRLGDWQHFLFSLSSLLRVKKDPAVEYLARFCVRVLCEHHWQPAPGILYEHLDDHFKPYSFTASAWGDFRPHIVSGWHSIQACWMIMDEAVRVKHYPTYRKGVEMGISTLANTYFEGKGITSTNNGAIVQPEVFPWGGLDDVLVYCLMVLEHTHEQKAIDYYNNCFALHNSRPEAVVTSGLLHTPRRFFYTINILDRMIKRNGNVSGIFD